MSRASSLAWHLLAWSLGALTLVWGAFVYVGYQTGVHEADELTDGHLASVSTLLLPLASGGLAADIATAPPGGRPDLRAHDYQRSLSVVVWDAQGRLLSRTGDAPLPAFSTAEGFEDLQLGAPARSWRAFSRWDGAHAHRLTVLLSEEERDELAEDIAQQVAQPGLWLLPVVALALGLAVYRGLRPLRTVAAQVHALDPLAAAPLPVPARFGELAAIADAVNLLVRRYQAALDRERALADEFAHELRTPLTALTLQVRGLRDAAGAEALREGLVRAEHEALRAGDVLQHLLALARASRAELDEVAQAFDVADVARRVVAEFAPHAHSGGRELGLASTGPFPVTGHPVLLELALRNLVQNALAHTPAGTHVEVEVDGPRRLLQVVDDGALRRQGSPAMAPESVRPLGWRLGHRVVEKVAALHGATFAPEVPLEGGRRGWQIRFGDAQV